MPTVAAESFELLALVAKAALKKNLYKDALEKKAIRRAIKEATVFFKFIDSVYVENYEKKRGRKHV